MLQIILAVLKVTGIVLLVILGVLAALILMVLFVPVRYEGHLNKEDGPLKADARAGWLFHLLGADLHVLDRRAVIKLKIFGKVLKTFYVPKGSGEPESEERKGAKQENEGQRYREPESRGHDSVKPESRGQDSVKPESEGQKSRGPESISPEPRGMESGRAEHGPASAVYSIIGKILHAVLGGLEIPSDISDLLDSVYDKTDSRIRTAREKYGPFLTAGAFGFYRRLLRYVGRFLHCCRFRTFDGYILIGTGQPDRTAEAAGLIYVLMPEAKGSYDVQADFYGKAFRTDTVFAGCIRLNHAAMLAVRLFRDREFRKLLAHIRHKDEKGSSRKKRGRKKKH